MKVDPLQFWDEEKVFQKYQELIAEVALGVSASSGAIERLFSIAGKIYRPERC